MYFAHTKRRTGGSEQLSFKSLRREDRPGGLLNAIVNRLWGGICRLVEVISSQSEHL